MKKILLYTIMFSVIVLIIGTFASKSIAKNNTEVAAQQCTDTSQTINSDGTEENAVLVSIPNSGWVSIVDALWIWNAAATTDDQAISGDTQTFTKTFNIAGTPLDSSITFAADNGYDIKVNGNSICANADEHNYESTHTCSIPVADLVTGDNTLSIKITNLPLANSTGETNPAGVIYSLTVNNNDCETQTGTIIIQKNTDDEANNGTFTFTGLPDASITTIDGEGSQEFDNLPTGNYSLAENPQTGWTLDSSMCISSQDADDDSVQINTISPSQLTLHDGETITCFFSNSKNNQEHDTGKILAIKRAIGGDGTFGFAASNSKHYFITTHHHFGIKFGGHIPVGNYTSTEDPQSGWTEVSNTCNNVTITTNHLTICKIVNKKTAETETDIKVHIYKYLGDNETSTQVPNDSTAPAFPMTATWNATNIGAGSGNYILGNNHGGTPLKYAADTSPMSTPADYTTREVTDGSVVVPTDSNECPAGKYRLLGYKSSLSSLADAETSSISPTAPVFTDLNADAYIIVVNTPCTAEAEIEEEVTTSPSSHTRHSGGGGSGAPAGQVLGAEDVCSLNLNTYMRKGYKGNNSEEVKILQGVLLNNFMNANLPVDGVYGSKTETAVKTFQATYKSDILEPWHIPMPTGIFYKTSLAKAKNLLCPVTPVPIPTDLINWSQNPALVN